MSFIDFDGVVDNDEGGVAGTGMLMAELFVVTSDRLLALALVLILELLVESIGDSDTDLISGDGVPSSPANCKMLFGLKISGRFWNRKCQAKL